jgi:hypothetical protein
MASHTSLCKLKVRWSPCISVYQKSMVAECIFHLNRQTTHLFQLGVPVVMHETCLDERQSAVGSSGMLKSRAVDISGRQLALTCGGEGVPTVLLETGLGAHSDSPRSRSSRFIRNRTTCTEFENELLKRSEGTPGPGKPVRATYADAISRQHPQYVPGYRGGN